jgi:hypothetical protein
MVHGLSAVKEDFAAAGFVTLVLDYRFFGASQGEPRASCFPPSRSRMFAMLSHGWRAETKWIPNGSVFGAAPLAEHRHLHGHVRWRVKAVWAHVTAVASPMARQALNAARWEAIGALLLNDRRDRYRTGVVPYLPVVAPDGTVCAVPGQENSRQTV